jgi:hypothetical protein
VPLEGIVSSDAVALRKILITGYFNHSLGYCMEEYKIYKIMIFPLVVYGYESYSVIFMKEHKLMVSENKVLRRMSGPKEDVIIIVSQSASQSVSQSVSPHTRAHAHTRACKRLNHTY